MKSTQLHPRMPHCQKPPTFTLDQIGRVGGGDYPQAKYDTTVTLLMTPPLLSPHNVMHNHCFQLVCMYMLTIMSHSQPPFPMS